MYGATIPEDEDAEAILSKLEQAKNQAPARRGFGLVVALCVGVVIGALGTIVLMAGGPEPQAPSPSRAAMELKIEECSADAIKYYQDHTDIIAFEFCMKRCHSDACYSLMIDRG